MLKKQPANILLIDDHEIVLTSLTRIIKFAGYNVHTSLTYQQAIAALSEYSFQLIISDIELGADSGIKLIQQAKTNQSFIFMSGNSQYQSQKELENYPFLLKPFSAPTLLHAIERSLPRIQGI